MKIPSVRLIIAGIIAALADLLELILFPVTAEGIFSPIADLIDIAVAGIMVSLLGWHWVFMPSIMGKVVPLVDVCPLWTMAVFFVGWGQSGQQVPGQQPGAHPMMPFPMPGTVPPPAQPAPQPQKELIINATPPAHATH